MKITKNDLERAGGYFSSQAPASEAWEYGVGVALLLANDPEYQALARQVVSTPQQHFMDAARAITTMNELGNKFGADSGDSHGVYLAVIKKIAGQLV